MSVFSVTGQTKSPELKFRKDGKFKIVQFTDLHFSVGITRSDSTLMLMKEVIELEHPDLIMLTGDVVTPIDPRRGWLTLTQVLVDAKIPWAVLFGNHDPENYLEISKKQIIETIARQPGNLTVNGPDDLSGNANYVLKVHASNSGKVAAAFYCLDSHGGRGASMYVELGIPVPDQSDWIKGDQVEWYRRQSRTLTKQNHGEPLPALAFFHIPLPEYRDVVGLPTTVGVREETICAQSINPGLFLSMYESGDVMGAFAGHDHDNNYIGCLRNICLAYGQVSGRQCYGKIGRGARIIELYEGERKFDTWILKLYDCDDKEGTWIPTNDTERKLFVTYPDSFVEKK
jgi:hypothetical protein